ncbi:hypothetical protein [Singulisphaera acidiphila]|uniref:Uncharacterized protein n=1 Tax=Singulisphaera acidiphila (strain ATCC BAA-1392 / DSM 18658 / VKM B-2454 / MOB10) TaxID=886293 RepID=L0DRQ9_SINAD|nr:hypothetical protein [Singulisphaera acidiphila]AGA31680.1 hypothetical protein Sinac_7650 [Singulisphaera acidiphila DSM 18658]
MIGENGSQIAENEYYRRDSNRHLIAANFTDMDETASGDEPIVAEKFEQLCETILSYDKFVPKSYRINLGLALSEVLEEYQEALKWDPNGDVSELQSRVCREARKALVETLLGETFSGLCGWFVGKPRSS